MLYEPYEDSLAIINSQSRTNFKTEASLWSSCSGWQPVKFWVFEMIHSTVSLGHPFQHTNKTPMKTISWHTTCTSYPPCLHLFPLVFHCAPLARDWLHILYKLPIVTWWQRLHNRNCYFSKSSDKKLERSFILHRSLFVCDHLGFPSINFLQKRLIITKVTFFCFVTRIIWQRLSLPLRIKYLKSIFFLNRFI